MPKLVYKRKRASDMIVFTNDTQHDFRFFEESKTKESIMI
jgi:hypothetical protein